MATEQWVIRPENSLNEASAAAHHWGRSHRTEQCVSYLELGENSVLILEAPDHAGSLASSYLGNEGFTRDLGSHLQFSHYSYYDQVLTAALSHDTWNYHQRSTWVWMNEWLCSLPIPMNLHHLPPQQASKCVEGLLQRPETPCQTEHFAAWGNAAFGITLTDLFMRPYNEKLWQCKLEDMGVMWIAERVAVPELSDVLRNLCLQTNSAAWGPNASFRYPKFGGTGSIWKAVANRPTEECFEFLSRVQSIDPVAKVATTANGESIAYEFLLSTVPLPNLATMVCNPEQLRGVTHLQSTRIPIVGIGLLGMPPESRARHCWSYFPQHDIPFYRLTVLSNLSSGCVPKEGAWSLMAEVAETHDRVQEKDDAVHSVITRLETLQLISQRQVISRWHQRLEFGYPVPTRGRDNILLAVFI